jgi:hypothetical protein
MFAAMKVRACDLAENILAADTDLAPQGQRAAQRFSAIRTRSLNDPAGGRIRRRGYVPVTRLKRKEQRTGFRQSGCDRSTVQTVTPLSRGATLASVANRRIRHHPPERQGSLAVPPHRCSVGLQGGTGVAAVTAHQLTESQQATTSHKTPAATSQPSDGQWDCNFIWGCRSVLREAGIGEVSNGYGLHPRRRGRRVA